MFSKLRRKFGCKFYSLELKVNNEIVDIKNFTFNYNEHYTLEDDMLVLTCKLDVKLKWRENGKKKEKEFDIESGFEWDGASIPDIFQKLIGKPKDPAFALASCIHDKLVGLHWSHYIESRAFYEVLKTRKGKFDIPWYKEKAMYIAVYAWSIWTA